MPRLASLVIAAAVLVPGAARADVESWTEVGVEADVADDWSLSYDQHIRFDEDVSRLYAVMPEVSVDYKPVKWLGLGVGYRLQYTRDGAEDDMRTRHRFFADAQTRRDVGKVRIAYRLKLQDQLRPDDPDDRWRPVARNRLEVAYRGFKPWYPAASVELHHGLDGEDQAVFLEKVWLTVGGAYSKKKKDLEIFYRAELPQVDAMDPTVHILGAAYHHDL